MGIFDAAFDSIGGALADQWKDIVTAPAFDEHTVVAPGIRKNSQNGRGTNRGAEDILSNGSLIFVPRARRRSYSVRRESSRSSQRLEALSTRDGQASVFDEQDRREKGNRQDSP